MSNISINFSLEYLDKFSSENFDKFSLKVSIKLIKKIVQFFLTKNFIYQIISHLKIFLFTFYF